MTSGEFYPEPRWREGDITPDDELRMAADPTRPLPDLTSAELAKLHEDIEAFEGGESFYGIDEGRPQVAESTKPPKRSFEDRLYEWFFGRNTRGGSNE